jgi:hypothetical protein
MSLFSSYRLIRCSSVKWILPCFVLTYLRKYAEGPPPDGSWTCDSCGNVNYPVRVKCNRRNCGADKPTESKAPPVSSSSPPATDQVCDVIVCMLWQVKGSSHVKCLLHLVCFLLVGLLFSSRSDCSSKAWDVELGYICC